MNYFSYYFVEAARMQFSPIRSAILLAQQLMTNKLHPLHQTTFGHNARVLFEIAERMTRKYEKLPFGIKKTNIDGKEYYIFEETVMKKPFCNLVQFNKVDYDERHQKKLLIVAPLAGHHATLLSSTVEELVGHFDVYITDWVNPCMVNTKHGEFDLEDYIEYMISFFGFLGPDLNVLAVCQPVVPVLAATAILSENKNQDNVPASVVLMGGPVDARLSPTKVNDFATSRPLKWFEDTVISVVPHNYPGAMRKVYPGFLQVAGFVTINWHKHFNSQIDLMARLLIEDDEKADKQKKFYDEYYSSIDLPAEYYLQTIKEVFQDFSLAKGTFKYNDKLVDLSKIKKTAIMVVEGERDDISGIGQTKAALHLCVNVRDDKKEYYLQPDVGHYGIFSGSKFRQFIAPRIINFVKKFAI